MQLNRFAKYAWFVVGWNVLVILWGAFVRASGSGAGCGSHWPLCNGEIVPQNPSIERIIEFTHRGMSGVALLLVAGLVLWAFRAFPWGRVRYGAVAAGVFILFEALIGAGLVLLGLVGTDDSAGRAVVIALHLVNTFLLLGALALTAWWASGGAAIQLRGEPLKTTALGVGLLGVAVVGMTGAITALGDTLFPSASLAQGLQQDIDPTAHFLTQLRVVHPGVAVLVALYVLYLTVLFKGTPGSTTSRLARALRVLVFVQLGAGAVNVLLLAPVWVQLVHLFLADMVWITLVLYAASLLAVERERIGREIPLNVPAASKSASYHVR